MSITLSIIVCIIIADFITGVIHWFEDAYGNPNWPIIGKSVIVHNIEHHRNPSKLAESNIIARNYQTVIPAIIICVLYTIWYGYSWQLYLVAFLAGFGNEVHAWNHTRKNNFMVDILHNACIIQTRKQHALHHRRPYNRYYCTLTNVTNVALEIIRFWDILEWTISLFGIKPLRLSDIRDGY